LSVTVVPEKSERAEWALLPDADAPSVGHNPAAEILRRARDSTTRASACLTDLLALIDWSTSWLSVGSLRTVHQAARASGLSTWTPPAGCECHCAGASSCGGR